MGREVWRYRWEEVGLGGVGMGERVSGKWSAGPWEVMVRDERAFRIRQDLPNLPLGVFILHLARSLRSLARWRM